MQYKWILTILPMIAIKRFRENADILKAKLALRGPGFETGIQAVIDCDSELRSTETRLQKLQAERNKLSKEIGKLRSEDTDTSGLEGQVKSLTSEVQRLSHLKTSLNEKRRALRLLLPNEPDDDVPKGSGASDNKIVRSWGEVSNPENPVDHLTIAARLGLVDVARAAKISGSGFVIYSGKGARLERALMNFLMDLHTKEHGYTEISPPLMVRKEALEGTSQLPKFKDQQYEIARDQLYLIPTAEVPLTNLHRDEILPRSRLPLKYAAFTPCFRREAGSTGVGTRGLIRMHQFDKVELVRICEPTRSDGADGELELLRKNAERVLQVLGLSYRVIELCTGDLGFGAAKTYDIEVWSPGQNEYLEVSSCTNFRDFQARRMNLRYKTKDGTNRLCHTLNGSGTALPRLYVALLETGLREDGTVRLPEALHAYFGADSIE
jgi:seryl-tRNA synthetase